MKKIIRQGLYWLALMGWIGVIFWFSSQPDLKSGLETWQDVVLRKGAHLTEYFVLTFWWLRALLVTRLTTRTVVIALGFAAVVAGLDEWYQTTVAGRHGSPLDVLVDVGGAVALLGFQRQSRQSDFPFAPTSKKYYTT